MKKRIALVLVLALFMSLGVTAWAAETAEPTGGNMPADRAMAATVLWVMAGQPVVNYAPGFEDLNTEARYMNAVRWAASEGIIKGYDARTFGPTDPVTREQFSVMLYRYAQKNGLGFTGAWYFPLTAADAGEQAVSLHRRRPGGDGRQRGALRHGADARCAEFRPGRLPGADAAQCPRRRGRLRSRRGAVRRSDHALRGVQGGVIRQTRLSANGAIRTKPDRDAVE